MYLNNTIRIKQLCLQKRDNHKFLYISHWTNHLNTLFIHIIHHRKTFASVSRTFVTLWIKILSKTIRLCLGSDRWNPYRYLHGVISGNRTPDSVTVVKPKLGKSAKSCPIILYRIDFSATPYPLNHRLCHPRKITNITK